MSESKIYRLFIFKAFFFCCGYLLFVSTNAAQAQNLPPKEIEASVVKIAKLVEDNYVFPEKGKKIAAGFQSEYKRGKFGNSNDWKEFSETATVVLRELSGDGHLYVRHDPQQVKELNNPPKENSGDDSSGENSFFYGAKEREKNYGFSEVKVLGGNIGYLKLSEINISEKSLPVLFAAMRFVADTKALTIDLRDNGGGGSEIGAVLESFFLPNNVALLEFRSRNGTVEVSRTVPWLIEKKYDAPVFVIVNKKTGSAAEAFTYSLQAKKRVTIIGQPSAGAAI